MRKLLKEQFHKEIFNNIFDICLLKQKKGRKLLFLAIPLIPKANIIRLLRSFKARNKMYPGSWRYNRLIPLEKQCSMLSFQSNQISNLIIPFAVSSRYITFLE